MLIPVGYSFTEGAIKVSAPHASGVYMIFNRREYIFVGESANIRKRLLEHLQRDDEGIRSHDPTYFNYELCPEDRRAKRRAELIQRLKPVCNAVGK